MNDSGIKQNIIPITLTVSNVIECILLYCFNFFNAKNNFLLAAIPLEINKIISSSSPLSKKQIIKELSNIYQNEAMIYYVQLLKDFTLKSKYKNRIGVTKVIIEEKAENYIRNNFDQKDIFIKNRFAKSFSSFLAFHNNLAIVPFSQDRTSRTIMLTYENTQREIKLLQSVNAPHPMPQFSSLNQNENVYKKENMPQ